MNSAHKRNLFFTNLQQRLIRPWFDVLLFQCVRSYRIVSHLFSGLYLAQERKRLLLKLGENLFLRYQHGEWVPPDLEPLTKEVERLTHKLQIKEMLIHAESTGTTLERHRHRENPSSEKREEI